MRGKVEITLNSPKTFYEIYVNCYCELRSRYTHEKFESYKIVLRSDESPLPAGKHSFSFEFEVNTYPISWQGENLSTNWYVMAYADIPLGRDKKVIRGITIDYAPSEKSIPFNPVFVADNLLGGVRQYDIFHKKSNQLFRRILPEEVKVYQGEGNHESFKPHIRLTLFSIFLSLLAIPSLWAHSTLGWICIALWLFFVPKTYFYYRKELERTRCGPLSVIVEKQDFKRGQTINIQYNLSPKKAVNIKKFTVQLEIMEVFYKRYNDYDDRNKMKIVTHTIPIQEIMSREDFILKPGEYHEQTLAIPLPPDLMHKVHTECHQILPQIGLHLETKHGNTISASLPLNITP
ncbi:hypothetical protein [Vibrio rhizosphaerae]|uniref:Arrestin C-terminal-like domain-containing protein n=1 Tax=Vibrio rhizosphaerae TaxID=398736 RepID=A0ABU4IX27_9VIBR|nr:hypothetical protein [Vibrio rhizosphaerae]MDW6093961.1 hypothetical protein [Vibrio rhizosphaerae]